MSLRCQPISARKSSKASLPTAIPSRMSASESVCMSGCIAASADSSRPLWQSPHCWVFARITPPNRRQPLRLSSRWQSTTAALPDPIVSDATDPLMSFRESGVGVQLADRVFDQCPPALGPHHHGRPNLPQFDHVRRLHHAVEQPQTGVRYVVNRAPSQAVPGDDARRRPSPARENRGTPTHESKPQSLRDRCPPPSAPFSPDSTLFSLGSIPRGQNRRSRMPVISSNRPCGNLKRAYNAPNRASISSELTISSGNV